MLESGPTIQWLRMPILETSSWLAGWLGSKITNYQQGFRASLNSSNTILICMVVAKPSQTFIEGVEQVLYIIHRNSLSLSPKSEDSKTNEPPDSPTKCWSSYITLHFLGYCFTQT